MLVLEMLIQVVFTGLLAISKATQPTPCPDSCHCELIREGGVSVECASYSELPADLPTGVVKLNLESNNLTSLSYNELKGATMSDLQALYLEGNKISYIPENATRNFPNLKLLDLTNNGLLKLHQNSFNFSTSLTTLLIGQNENLTLPTEEVFLYSSSISRLDLSDNNLQSLNIKIFKGLTNLECINIAGNPLNCTRIGEDLQGIFPKVIRVICDETETVDYWYVDRVTKENIESQRLDKENLRKAFLRGTVDFHYVDTVSETETGSGSFDKEKRIQAFLQDTVDSVLHILTLSSIYTFSLVCLVLICYFQILRWRRNSSVPYMSLYN